MGRFQFETAETFLPTPVWEEGVHSFGRERTGNAQLQFNWRALQGR